MRIRTNYMDDIVRTLAEKHGMTEEKCRLTLKYIVDRSVEIMEETDTIAFNFHKLGYAYTSIFPIRRAKNFRHHKKEVRAEKYEKLKEWIDSRSQTYNLRVRFRSMPRIYRRYFRIKKSNLELQDFQNGHTGE
jgi:hypothetical protein